MATNKKLSAISWYERTHTDCRPKFTVSHNPTIMLVSERIKDEDLGRMVTKTSLKAVDIRKRLSQYKVSDFSIESLQAIGADLSKSVSMSLNSLAINDSILSSIK